MPVFKYKGFDEAGKAVSGTHEADSPKSLRAQLRKTGVFPTDVVDASPGAAGRASGKGGSKPASFRRRRVGSADIAMATDQLATLVGAGIPLVEALTGLIEQTDNERLKSAFSDVKQRVNEGSSLGDALATHSKIFGNLYVNMVRAGEHSGALDVVLTQLSGFTRNQDRLRQKLIGAMVYPAIMTVIGGGILVLLMVVVIPKITKVFADVKQVLPWTTRVLIWSSNVLRLYWWLIFPLAILGCFLFFEWMRSPKGKPVWDRWSLKFPIFGPLVRMVAIARFSRTFETLLRTGVPLLSAMDIVKNVVTNSVMSKVVERAREAVREGESIATPLQRSGEFPPLVYRMVASGEQSGRLEDMLGKVADSFESQVDTRVVALTTLLEPLIIVVMGVVIGFVAFSILMPILQINNAIH